jgi:hypothetical protein
VRPMLLARADEVLEYSFGLFRYSQASRQHGNQRQGATFASPMKARHRTESDGVGMAVGIHLTAYALVFGLRSTLVNSTLAPRAER